MTEAKKLGRPPKSSANTAKKEDRPEFTDKKERPPRVRRNSGQKLDAPKRSGYQRYWASDRPGELEDMQANYWEFVRDGDQKIRRPGGLGVWLYLMEIEEHLYIEDMEADAALSASYQVESSGSMRAASSESPGEYLPMGRDTALTRG